MRLSKSTLVAAVLALAMASCRGGRAPWPPDGGEGPDAGLDAGADAGLEDAGLDASVPLKTRCRGVMDRAGPPDASVYPFMDSTVVMVNWSDLEPGAGDFDAGQGWAQIDGALDAGWRVKLRIMAGIHSPEWVEQLVGPTLSLIFTDGGVGVACDAGVGVWDPNGGAPKLGRNSGCVPAFWTTPVQQAYAGLMQEVARRYEANDNLAEVVDSLCMTVYDEVLFRGHCQPDSVADLVDAGFNFALDQACQLFALQTHAQVFPRTRTAMSVNDWDELFSDGGCLKGDSTFPDSASLVSQGSALLGDRLILQHNHLGMSDPCYPDGGPLDSCTIKAYPGPRGFQTRVWADLDAGTADGGNVGGLYLTLQNAVSLNANFVELPNGYPATDAGVLQYYDQLLRQTPPP